MKEKKKAKKIKKLSKIEGRIEDMKAAIAENERKAAKLRERLQHAQIDQIDRLFGETDVELQSLRVFIEEVRSDVKRIARDALRALTGQPKPTPTHTEEVAAATQPVANTEADTDTDAGEANDVSQDDAPTSDKPKPDSEA